MRAFTTTITLAWIALVAVCVAAIYFAGTASAHHTGVLCKPGGDARCLPLMERSAARAELRSTQSLTWCVNARAAAYPNFVSQVREVNADHEAKLGVRWVEVPGTFETPQQARNAGCQVQHNMPDVHGCSACSGWVHYLNWPVLIEYRWQAGHILWHTTISHELVHVYGLHEHYDDARFVSHFRTYGRWAFGLDGPGTSTDAPTVMDFGTGVWRMTEYDVKYSCQSLDPDGVIFDPCRPAPVDCSGPSAHWGDVVATWNPCLGRWMGENGIDYEPSTGDWWRYGTREWASCEWWGGRYAYRLSDLVGAPVFVPGWSSVYVHGDGWTTAPAC